MNIIGMLLCLIGFCYTEPLIQSINDLEQYIGSRIDELPTFSNYSMQEEEISEYDDLHWPAKIYYKNGIEIFRIEANWEHPSVVHRITIVSNLICYGDEIFVGQSVGNIRSLLDSEIPTAPDGYLYLKLKNNHRIYLEIDIMDAHQLSYGASNLNQIPKELTISSIILM